MILKVFVLVAIMSVGGFGENTPSTDTYAFMALVPTLNAANFLDGPANISHAPTTPTTNSEPTLDDMQYYNYISAAMYCQYQLNDLSCDYCRYFEEDIFDYT